MVLRCDEQDAAVFEIDTWVMSCRVFGRQLEDEAMNIAVEACRERGIRQLRARYVPTPKNAVVCNLYSTLGFMPCDSPSAGGSRWYLNLTDYVPRDTHITRRSE